MAYRGTAQSFGAFLLRTVGHFGYLMGTRGQRITRAMIDSRLASSNYRQWWDTIRANAPKWLTGNPGKAIDGKDAWIVADCQGWLDAFWSGVDLGKPIGSPVYVDTSTYTQWAKVIADNLPHGPIAGLPRNCPYPLAVCHTGHVGFYYQGAVYQSRGTAYGTVKTDLPANKWTDWYMIPYLDYEGWMPGDGDTVLQLGSKGAAVRGWQIRLIQWNSAALPKYKADSDFGGETVAWTNTFKTASGLPTDGIVDDLTWDAMVEVLKVTGPSQAELDAAKAQITDLTDQIVAAKAAQMAAEQYATSRDGEVQRLAGKIDAFKRGLDAVTTV